MRHDTATSVVMWLVNSQNGEKAEGPQMRHSQKVKAEGPAFKSPSEEGSQARL